MHLCTNYFFYRKPYTSDAVISPQDVVQAAGLSVEQVWEILKRNKW